MPREFGPPALRPDRKAQAAPPARAAAERGAAPAGPCQPIPGAARLHRVPRRPPGVPRDDRSRPRSRGRLPHKAANLVRQTLPAKPWQARFLRRPHWSPWSPKVGRLNW